MFSWNTARYVFKDARNESMNFCLILLPINFFLGHPLSERATEWACMERIVFHVAVAFVTDSMRTFERSALSLSVFAERGEANRALLLGHAKMPPKQSIFFFGGYNKC